ncbi:MAG: ABC-F family ATP-binding cassette domain-containing protein [Planctomycetia bacterium]
MLLLSCEDLSRAFSGDPLFEGIGFELRAGDRVGLVGPNGAGKSTLMKLLAGLDQPDTGVVRLHAGARVALLRQHAEFQKGRTLFEEARSGLDEFLALQEELVRVADELAQCRDENLHSSLSARYDRLNEALHQNDAYTVDHRIEEVLDGLGFTRAEYDKPVDQFSGGQIGRLMLAKLLLSSPDVMLLDEPSNHLDVGTVKWLEEYLVRQKQAMLIVSHDRCFLDRVVNRIMEMAGKQLNDYPGNFQQYWRLRRERYEAALKAYEAQREHIEKQEEYIRRNSAGQMARQAQGRQKILDRVERLKRPVLLESPRMHFGEVKRTGDLVLEVSEVSKKFDKPLFQKLSFQLQRGKKLGIYGPNGCGKSTLLSMLLGNQKPDSGTVKLGHQVQFGYYDQHLRNLNPALEVLRASWPENDPDITEQEMRDLLGRFGLQGDVVSQKVSSLSGGEKSRACLARLVREGSNVLVLDEPTNHLDLWACDALEEALLEFTGTAIIVSHDRYLLNRVVDMLVVMDGVGGIKVVPGNFELYERMNLQAEIKTKPAQESIRQQAKQEPKKKRKFPYRKVEDIEADISKLEQERDQLEKQMIDPDLYRDGNKVKQVTKSLEETKQKLETLYEHWEEAVSLSK